MSSTEVVRRLLVLRAALLILSIIPIFIWIAVAATKYRLDPYNDTGGIYDSSLNSMSVARIPLLIGIVWNALLLGLTYKLNRQPWAGFVCFIDFCLWVALLTGCCIMGILFFPRSNWHDGGAHWNPSLGELMGLVFLLVCQSAILGFSVMEIECVRRRKNRRRSKAGGSKTDHPNNHVQERSSHELDERGKLDGAAKVQQNSWST